MDVRGALEWWKQAALAVGQGGVYRILERVVSDSFWGWPVGRPVRARVQLSLVTGGGSVAICVEKRLSEASGQGRRLIAASIHSGRGGARAARAQG